MKQPVKFLCIILLFNNISCSQPQGEPVPISTIQTTETVDFFTDDFPSEQMPQELDFNKPPQPSRLTVLLRKIGIPIFLKYVQFYTWVRNWVYWCKAKLLAGDYIQAENTHATNKT